MSTMANKLNVRVVSFSLAGVSGILYLACALFFIITPEITIMFFQYMFHGINITQIATEEISFINILIGLIEIIIFALISGWIFVKIYNSLIAKGD